jgi:predicted O-methyltransferase YrrM
MGLRTFLGLKKAPHNEGIAVSRPPMAKTAQATSSSASNDEGIAVPRPSTLPTRSAPPRSGGASPTWRDDHLIDVDGVLFDSDIRTYDKRTTDEKIVLLKTRNMLDRYAEIFAANDIKRILEFGTWEGGSPIYFAATTTAEKIVGIDLRGATEEILFHASSYKDRLSLYYRTSQSDGPVVRKIIAEEFSGPLDLVIDDASHMYEHTKRSFEIAFPYLRPGGLYIIEDWNWAHYESDRVDLQFERQPAVTNLAFELAMAVGSYSAVESVDVTSWALIIRKRDKITDLPTDGSFTLDSLVRLRPHRSFSKL